MSQGKCFSDRTIKVSHAGETRRAKLPVEMGTTAAESFDTIKGTVLALFGMDQISAERITLRYYDDEGDLCTLTAQTLDDLAQLSPEGVLKLTLMVEPESVTDVKMDAPTRSDGVKADSDDVALRDALKEFLQKIDPNARGFARNILGAMDSNVLHKLVGVALSHIRSDEGSGSDARSDEHQKLQFIIPRLHSMEPSAMQALVIDVLCTIDGDSSGVGSCSPPAPGQEQANPLAAILGAVLGGKGAGKGGCPAAGSVHHGISCDGCNEYPITGGRYRCNTRPDYDLCRACFSRKVADGEFTTNEFDKIGDESDGTSSNPASLNPMAALLSAFGGCKGFGKGAQPQDFSAAQPQAQNPMEAMLGAFLGKGYGKGAPAPASESPVAQASAQNPMEAMLGAFLGKGCGKGASVPASDCPMAQASPQNPMDMLGAFLGKGLGKGVPTPATTFPAAEANAERPSGSSAEAEEMTSSRKAFEESVDDLVNMGLVSDRQMARELLTLHGDISAVVAVLTEDS